MTNEVGIEQDVDLPIVKTGDPEIRRIRRARTSLLTVAGGTVHRDDCPIAKRAATWPWQARNDGPGVAKACSKCLPDGLPAEES